MRVTRASVRSTPPCAMKAFARVAARAAPPPCTRTTPPRASCPRSIIARHGGADSPARAQSARRAKGARRDSAQLSMAASRHGAAAIQRRTPRARQPSVTREIIPSSSGASGSERCAASCAAKARAPSRKAARAGPSSGARAARSVSKRVRSAVTSRRRPVSASSRRTSSDSGRSSPAAETPSASKSPRDAPAPSAPCSHESPASSVCCGPISALATPPMRSRRS